MRGYCKLREEALDRIQWRTRCGRACGPVIIYYYYYYYCVLQLWFHHSVAVVLTLAHTGRQQN